MEREEQDCLDEHRRRLVDLETLQDQIRGKVSPHGTHAIIQFNFIIIQQMAKLEQQRTLDEDRLEMERISEQMRRQRIEGTLLYFLFNYKSSYDIIFTDMEATRKRKNKMAEELLEQIRFQEKVLADRAKEEKKLNDAFIYLSQLEYEREIDQFKNTTQIAKRERMQYRQHLKELEQERKEEEKKLSELLEEHRKAVEKKQDDARCKILEAKEKLLHVSLKNVFLHMSIT